jgi:hypothetical protein
VRLVVPEKYNLEPCQIEVPGVSGDAVALLQENFQTWARQHPAISLVAQVNHLAQHMHDFARAASKLVVPKPPEPSNAAASEQEAAALKNARGVSKPLRGDVDDRSHIITIPRPPEWAVVDGDEDSDSEDSSAYDSGDETDEEAAAVEEKPAPSGPERGILISFPYLELHGIELLELSSLCITAKCDRCKDQVDVQKLKNNDSGDHSGMKSVVCKKCSNQLGIGMFRTVSFFLLRSIAALT